MNLEELFIKTISELELKSAQGSGYDLIRTSALLRQLLLDSPSLIVSVNRTYREKIRFKVQKRGDLFPRQGQLALHGINPHPNFTTEELNLDSFLSLKVVYYHLSVFTVRDIIVFTANKLGGVHYDNRERKNEKERSLDHLRINEIKVSYSDKKDSELVDFVIAQMTPISVAVIQALEPLKRRLSNIQ